MKWLITTSSTQMSIPLWKREICNQKIAIRGSCIQCIYIILSLFSSFWIVFCFLTKGKHDSTTTQVKRDFGQNLCIWNILVCRSDIDNPHSSLPLRPDGFSILFSMSFFPLPFFLLHNPFWVQDTLPWYFASIFCFKYTSFTGLESDCIHL